MSKIALVTGASGFIGYNLCNKLFNDGWTVIATGNKDENKPLCHKFLCINLNGINYKLLPPEIDVCFHQAANNDTTDMDIENMFESNLKAPASLFLTLAKEFKCKKFVYASSCSVYGNNDVPYKESENKISPLNPYAESKYSFELFAKNFSDEYKITAIGLRYTNVYGPGEMHKKKRSSMINQLLQIMLLGERPKIFKFGEQLRDWVYIDDVVNANLLAANYDQTDVFNVGSGVATNFNDLVKIINKELNSSLEPEYIDCLFKSKYQIHTLVDLNHISEKLGYKVQFDINKGIRSFIETKKAMA